MAGLSQLSAWWSGTARPRPAKLIKRVLPRGLFGRALLIIVTPVVVVQLVATYVFFERHWDQVGRRLALGVGGDIAMIINLLEQFPGPENRQRIFVDALYGMHFKVTLAPGQRLPATPPKAGHSILDRMLPKVLAEHLSQPFQVDTRGTEEWIGVDVQLAQGLLRVAVPRDRVASSTTTIFMMWMVGTAVVLVVIALLFMRNQLRPIHRLAQAADDLGKGRPVTDFKPSGATEVRRASAAFLVMRDRIERQVRQRTEMLAGVSHDLRTPLTRMKLQLAMLGDSAEIVDLRSDLAEMENMVEGYLDFARGRDTEAAVATDLGELLAEVVSEARRQGGTVEVTVENGLVVALRPNAIKRCLTNLVDNARRHAERITIEARRQGSAVEVTIDDDGPGIPEAQREEAFKPFHRLDPARTPDRGGSGLGLSIARDVARGHGGDITLSEAPSGGLRALLRLPV